MRPMPGYRAGRPRRPGKAAGWFSSPTAPSTPLRRTPGARQPPIPISRTGPRMASRGMRRHQRHRTGRPAPPTTSRLRQSPAQATVPPINRIYGLYSEEGLTVRKRKARRKAIGTRAPILIEARVNARWSLDFVHDQFACGRRFRVLNVVDDVTRECLAAIPDTSISGRRVARELTTLIERRGKPIMELSRICAAPSARLGHLAFEGQGAFASQC